MRRLGITVVVALSCLALPVTASAQTVLTPGEFAAIDAVYAAFGAFADANGATATDRRRARAACTGLGSASRVLSGLRRSCNAQLSVGPALGASARCKGRASCLVAVRRVRRALNELLVRSRASNRNVSAAGFAASCRRELRVDLRTLTYYTRLRNGFALLERALRTRSGTLARRAERRINALREPDSRSAEQQRLAFQSACGPPSAYP
jgi:hypothetical protein